MEYELKQRAIVRLNHGEYAVLTELLDGYPNVGQWRTNWMGREDVEITDVSTRDLLVIEDFDPSEVRWVVEKRAFSDEEEPEEETFDTYEAAMRCCQRLYEETTYRMYGLMGGKSVEIRYWNGRSVWTY